MQWRGGTGSWTWSSGSSRSWQRDAEIFGRCASACCLQGRLRACLPQIRTPGWTRRHLHVNFGEGCSVRRAMPIMEELTLLTGISATRLIGLLTSMAEVGMEGRTDREKKMDRENGVDMDKGRAAMVTRDLEARLIRDVGIPVNQVVSSSMKMEIATRPWSLFPNPEAACPGTPMTLVAPGEGGTRQR